MRAPGDDARRALAERIVAALYDKAVISHHDREEAAALVLAALPAQPPAAGEAALLSEVDEYLDDIADGTPDAPVYAYRAAQLLAKLRDAAREARQ